MELEFTWTLLVGPPTILTVALPLTSKECAQTGFNTIMGMGTLASTRPHSAKARTSEVRCPITSVAKVSPTRSTTSVRR